MMPQSSSERQGINLNECIFFLLKEYLKIEKEKWMSLEAFGDRQMESNIMDNIYPKYYRLIML